MPTRALWTALAQAEAGAIAAVGTPWTTVANADPAPSPRWYFFKGVRTNAEAVFPIPSPMFSHAYGNVNICDPGADKGSYEQKRRTCVAIYTHLKHALFSVSRLIMSYVRLRFALGLWRWWCTCKYIFCSQQNIMSPGSQVNTKSNSFQWNASEKCNSTWKSAVTAQSCEL